MNTANVLSYYVLLLGLLVLVLDELDVVAVLLVVGRQRDRRGRRLELVGRAHPRDRQPLVVARALGLDHGPQRLGVPWLGLGLGLGLELGLG